MGCISTNWLVAQEGTGLIVNVCKFEFWSTEQKMLKLDLTSQHWCQMAQNLPHSQWVLCGIICIHGFTMCYVICVALHPPQVRHNTGTIYNVYNIGKYNISHRPEEAMLKAFLCLKYFCV